MGGEGQTEIVLEFECKTKNVTTNRVKNLINSSVHIRIAKIMEANKINKVMDIVSIQYCKNGMCSLWKLSIGEKWKAPIQSNPW